MGALFSISTAAREIGCLPRDISDAIYAGHLDSQQMPTVAGRRIVTADYLEVIRQTMTRLGKVRTAVAASA